MACSRAMSTTIPPPSPEWLATHIVSGAPEAILFAGRDGAIRLWNAGAEAMFGWSAAEAVGRPLDLIIPERLRGRHWDGWNKVMETGATRYGAGELLAVPALRKDGSTLSIEFSIQLLRDEAGQITGSVAIVRDVTERWKRDKELSLRVKELERQSKELGPPR
jgi:PAS domain S-box-containing protein